MSRRKMRWERLRASRGVEPDVRGQDRVRSVAIGTGGMCPVCSTIMSRLQHGLSWRPAAGRGYARFWDRCPKCQHVEYYSHAWVKPETPAEPKPQRRQDLRGVNSLPGITTEPTVEWAGPRSRPDQPPWAPAEEDAP